MNKGEARIGIIGGTGLYEIEGLEQARWVSIDTPFGEPSDQLLLGRFKGREVVFLPRHGRGHRLLPSELNHRANLYALRSLNVRWVLSVSAVGSLQPKYHLCDVVLPDQFFDRTKKSREHTFFGDGIVAHISFAHPVCDHLVRLLYQVCQELGIRVHKGGVYVNIEGPAFSTRAESLFYQRMGFDVIGMTNIGEAKCAREAEIAYATIAMVADYDCWKEEEEHVSVEVVVENLRKNTELAKRILSETVPRIPTQVPFCECHRALQNAILTDRTLWPSETVARLRPLLDPYLKERGAN